MRREVVLIAALVASVALAAAPATGAGSGIRVRAVSSPTCPVERIPPDPMCAPRPFPASVRVVRVSDHRTGARLHTGPDRRAVVALRPGGYRLVAGPESGAQLPRCPEVVSATVRSGRYARATVDCDSGIR